MNWLKTALLLYALLALVGFYFLITRYHNLWAGLYVVTNGVLVGVAAIFERGRYNPKISSQDSWEATHETFQDATSGKWVTVHYNSQTGERKYVEVEKESNKS